MRWLSSALRTCRAGRGNCEVSRWKVSLSDYEEKGQPYPWTVGEHALPGPEGKEGRAKGQSVSLAVHTAARAGAKLHLRTLL
eukprot:11145406-Alexandrium_andersonii.AAC.1